MDKIGALVDFSLPGKTDRTGWLPGSLVDLLYCLSLGDRGLQCWPLSRGEDEEAVSGCLLMVRSVVSSTDSGLSLVTLGPLHITGHNSTHLAV